MAQLLLVTQGIVEAFFKKGCDRTHLATMASMKQNLSHNLTIQLRLIHILRVQGSWDRKGKCGDPNFLAVWGTGDLRRAHTMNLNKIWMF